MYQVRLLFPRQKSVEPNFAFVTKKKGESIIFQMGFGSFLSVIRADPVQYMPSVEEWKTW